MMMKKPLSIALLILIVLIIVISSVFFTAPSTPDFQQYPAGKARKAAFFNYFMPLVTANNQEISIIRAKLLDWRDHKNNIGWWDARQIADLAEQYRVTNFVIDDESSWKKLLIKVDILPPSLVLAQAANESAWGTSRFATSGNNFFGQWCYKKGCGLVPKKRGSDQEHEVAAFNSPQESLESYMQNLNSHQAYKELRAIRAQLRTNKQTITGVALSAGLTKYSERGQDYIAELRAMIKFNKLAKYDK